MKRGLPAAAQVVECYLGLTETFIHEYIAAFRSVRPVVIAARFEHLDLYPLPTGATLHRSPPPRGTLAWAASALRRRMHGGAPHLESILAREGVGVVHAHFGPTACRLLEVRRRTGLPLVTSFYGYDASMTGVIAEFKTLYGDLFEVGDVFLVEGTSMRRKLEDLGCSKGKLRLQRIGVDPLRYRFREREAPGSGPVTILQCGRMVAKKGYDVALRALALARRDDRRLQLRILGDGPERANLEALIAGLGLENAVVLLGRAPRGRFLEELDRAHLYLQPSRTSADGDSEGGAPTTLLEAQACGLPIISTRHADIPEIVREGDSAVLCDENDVSGVAAALTELAASPQRWGSMGRAGRDHVATQHDVRKLVLDLESLYVTLSEER